MVILGFRSSLKAISPMKEKRGGSTVAGKGGVVRGDTEFISDEQEQLEQEMLQKITSQQLAICRFIVADVLSDQSAPPSENVAELDPEQQVFQKNGK
ncbi:hypothetical protein Q1695_009589 [Nippostrongylus brasiliensis]|nr:hypothetical protein Q1695_009589 [Nippostrongylus brasiliensis]